MRSRRYAVITRLERINNRLTRFALRRGWAPRAFALLETVGRRSGQPRHTPVGNGLVGDTFWLVAAHARASRLRAQHPGRAGRTGQGRRPVAGGHGDPAR